MHTNIKTTSLLFALTLGLIPLSAHAAKTQKFLLTAYYSPLPNQCCYVRGNYEADKVLNGQGTHAADGTPVYPGMVAAPPSYAFGTKIDLPGLGVVTVHDRGGAILEQEDGVHRIDVWVGHGEEGLARALTFGVKRITGTIYEPGESELENTLTIEQLPAPLASIQHLKAEPTEISVGEKNDGIIFLQDALRQLGYFAESSTGFFGPVTEASIGTFFKDYGLDNSEQTLKEKAKAFLVAALWRTKARQPIAQFIEPGADKKSVKEAQRILAFLGFYKGRRDGMYSDRLRSAIIAFQKSEGIIATENDAGAGRIGPVTRGRILVRWNAKIVKQHADKIIALQKIETVLKERGTQFASYVGQGKSGNDVEVLQGILADLGYISRSDVNGIFGSKTVEAVAKYQIAHKLIVNMEDAAAGFVGPATLEKLQNDQKQLMYAKVRAYGWDAL